jgi:hypothetical protein
MSQNHFIRAVLKSTAEKYFVACSRALVSDLGALREQSRP